MAEKKKETAQELAAKVNEVPEDKVEAARRKLLNSQSIGELSANAQEFEKVAGGATAKSAPAEDEPTFHGKPLSAYDRYGTEDELTALDGIGAVTAKDILRARAKRDRAR